MDKILQQALSANDRRTAIQCLSKHINVLWHLWEKDIVSHSYARNATAYAFCLMMERFNAMGWKPETEFFKMMSGIDLQE